MCTFDFKAKPFVLIKSPPKDPPHPEYPNAYALNGTSFVFSEWNLKAAMKKLKGKLGSYTRIEDDE